MSRRKLNKGFEGFDSDDNRPELSALNENAESTLRAGLDNLKRESAEPSDLAALRHQIEISSSRKEQNFMSEIQNKIKAHPRFSLLFVSAMAVLIFVVLVPFSYQKTIGYQVEYAIGDIQHAPTPDAINSALAAIGYGDARATFTNSPIESKCMISILPNMGAVRESQALISSIMGAFSSPKISPVVEVVSGSLYAQAKDKIIKVEIDAKNKTDQQIQDEIKSKLEAQGFKSSVVYVKSNRDSIGADSSRQLKYELTIKGNCSIADSDSSCEILQIDGRGKTPEQIEAEVNALIASKGMTNAKVRVKVTEPSSDTTQKQQIKIEIKDSTGD
jgi:hypothetical protein